MIACLQRCTRAEVRVDGRPVAAIGRGLLVLLGVGKGDGDRQADALADRIAHFRIFEDAAGKMNVAAHEAGASLLVVSQFTLAASTRKGRRPSFDGAASPDEAEPLYRRFVARLRDADLPVDTGTFGARMEIELVNDGPVTFLLEESRG